jgi:hypothetical protein
MGDPPLGWNYSYASYESQGHVGYALCPELEIHNLVHHLCAANQMVLDQLARVH